MKNNDLAINGGVPVRNSLLPYGTQFIKDKDVEAVSAVLTSGWLTTGPMVERFEAALASEAGKEYAVVFSNGTAALHGAMFALGVSQGDEVIVPAISFVASANCVAYQGGEPRFCDVEEDTLLIDPKGLSQLLTEKTKAVVAVDYGGQPCNYDKLLSFCRKNNLYLVSDACHSIGSVYKGKLAASMSDMSVFSFHPVKHIACGEGGAVVTDSPEFVSKLKQFRNHGIATDFREREVKGSWHYDMIDLGYNYRLSDIHCALGLSQLNGLRSSIERRNAIASVYSAAFSPMKEVVPLSLQEDLSHAWHLYVVKFDLELLSADRQTIFSALRAEGIGVNVHYIPIYLHSWYRSSYGTSEGLCPVAERCYERILSLPMFPSMSDSDVSDVISAVKKVVNAYRK